jgi:HK97 family phage major capsid protein
MDTKAGARNSAPDAQRIQQIGEHANAISQTVQELLATRSIGGAVTVKALNETTAIVAGYGVVFGGQDLVGDTFTKTTDFGLDRDANGMPVYYDHGLHKVLKARIGTVKNANPDDAGLFFEIELDRSQQYVNEVLRLVDAGKIGLSTGALSHLVRQDTKSITQWLVGEVSLTPTPAEPRTIGVQTVETKATYEVDGDGMLDNTTGSYNVTGVEDPMPSEETHQEDTMEAKMEAKMARLEARLANALNIIENSPTLKSAGYVNEGMVAGGTKNNSIRTFANWLMAVVRGDHDTLKNYALKDGVTNTTGEAGGYLVPPNFIDSVMSLAAEGAIVRPRAMKVPLPCDVPALNQYGSTTPSGGVSNYFGGMQWSWGDADETISETSGDFYNIHMEIIELKGVTSIANSMLRSVRGLDTYFTRMIGEGVGYMEDYAYMRGSGVGEPLGVYNSDALLSYTLAGSEELTMEDVEGMVGNLVNGGNANAVWVCNQHLRGELAGIVTYVQGIEQSLVTGTLAGLPIIFSDKLPATLNAGGLLLADFSKYLVGPMNAVEILFDPNAYFTKNKAGLRIVCYTNGTPWMRGTVKTSSSTYASAFIRTYHS